MFYARLKSTACYSGYIVYSIFYAALSTACFQCHENYATESRLRNHLEQHRNEEGKLTPGCAIDGMEAAFCHLIAGLLYHVMGALHLSTLEELCQCVISHCQIPKHHLQHLDMVPLAMEQYSITKFASFIGEKLPDILCLVPPNCVSVLVHWGPLYVHSVLPKGNLKSFAQLTNKDGRPVETVQQQWKEMPCLADDQFRHDTGHKGPIAQLKALNCCLTRNMKLAFYVANFSFLSSNNTRWSSVPDNIRDPLAK